MIGTTTIGGTTTGTTTGGGITTTTTITGGGGTTAGITITGGDGTIGDGTAGKRFRTARSGAIPKASSTSGTAWIRKRFLGLREAARGPGLLSPAPP